MPERMIDSEDYDDLANIAATEYARKQDYSGSAEALAFKMAFVAGANLSTTLPPMKVIRAVAAGRKWAVSEKSTRRLVAFGKIRPGYPDVLFTTHTDTTSDELVLAAGLPLWTPPEDDPEVDPDEDMRDPDLHRKHEAEDA